MKWMSSPSMSVMKILDLCFLDRDAERPDRGG
jgi:hypothetical protein